MHRVDVEVGFECVHKRCGPRLASDGVEEGGVEDCGVRLVVRWVGGEEGQSFFQEGGCELRWLAGGLGLEAYGAS